MIKRSPVQDAGPNTGGPARAEVLPGDVISIVHAFYFHNAHCLVDDQWATARRLQFLVQIRNHQLKSVEATVESLVWKIQTLQSQLDEAQSVLEQVSQSRAWRLARLLSAQTRSLMG